jgi:hypothetical protein
MDCRSQLAREKESGSSIRFGAKTFCGAVFAPFAIHPCGTGCPAQEKDWESEPF